jgi:mitochondrial fission protein ELM1
MLSTPSENQTKTPQVWLLMGYRAGESGQLMALAEALGWPFEIKRLVYRKWGFLIDLPCLIGLGGIHIRHSSPLEPPWPDVVISAGLRNEPVARWIRRQAQGQVRLVHIGRPWAALHHFDLIITTPQYRLPQRPNVLHNHTTLHRVTPQRLAAAGQAWAERLSHLPRPYIALLVGGHSGPYTLDVPTAIRLAQQASHLAHQHGATLLVTTSARTPPAATDALLAALSCPAYVYRWSSDTDNNPYYGFLALAEAFIVTGESVSMLTEACATQKPVSIFPFGRGSLAMGSTENENMHNVCSRNTQTAKSFRLKALTHKLGTAMGPRRMQRDIRIMHEWLISTGRAVWLGETFPPGPMPTLVDDIAQSVKRVRDLLVT